jgi:hypothetical protein
MKDVHKFGMRVSINILRPCNILVKTAEKKLLLHMGDKTYINFEIHFNKDWCIYAVSDSNNDTQLA